MSTAADRKKAREVYLATLNQQRDENKTTAQPTPTPAAPVAFSSREQKLNAREQMLEEKRQKFLQKSGKLPISSDNSAGNSGNTNPPPTTMPPRFQPPQQQLQQPQQPQPSAERNAYPESLQAGKHGDDGANTLATRYGQKDDPVYRPKPKPKVVSLAPPPPSSDEEDPFHTGTLQPSSDSQQHATSTQKDPFAHTINPRGMQTMNAGAGAGAGAGVGLGQIGMLCMYERYFAMYNTTTTTVREWLLLSR